MNVTHVKTHKRSLKEKIALEASTFHFTPYKRILVKKSETGEDVEDCRDKPPRAIDEFPTDFLNKEQRIRGYFLIHIFLVIYFFIFLAIICDKYFIPSVERFCQVLNISQVSDNNYAKIVEFSSF